jgi:7-cyano-7-deazaguanine synthase in queuosine biosynthesis
MRVRCEHPERARRLPDGVGVALFGTEAPGIGSIGHQLLHRVLRLRGQPSQRAWDFLSLALGVVAADTFVRRDQAEDGWSRRIELSVSLVEPDAWTGSLPLLRHALGFLSGDDWRLEVTQQGVPVPQVKVQQLPLEDAVCLLSGGLDSLVGAIDLVHAGRTPILVSHSYPKEGEIQSTFAQFIGPTLTHFHANVHPRYEGANEISMRCRSLLFLAMGVVAASSLQQTGTPIDLTVPENGLISLNPPLTPRRIGSLSTRTTHPYFLRGIGQVLTEAGINVRIVNPYIFRTKGEMVSGCLDPRLLRSLGPHSMSCGKWKRKNRPCGRCLPCLIRRAALHAAGEPDRVDYVYDDLRLTLGYEDVVAVRTAVERYRGQPMEPVLRAVSPLPSDPADRRALASVAERGIRELDRYLSQVL